MMRFLQRLLILISGLFPLLLFSQIQSGTKSKATGLIHLVNKFHVSPKETDDSLSAHVYSEIIDELNENGVFLLAEEEHLLSQYRFLLDDELTGNEWVFLPLANSVFRKALLRMKNTIQELGGQPFKFDKNEFYYPAKYRSQKYFPSETALKENTRLWFKYKILNELVDYGLDEEITDFKKLMKSEPDIRKKIKDEETETFDYYLKDNTGKILESSYLNAICSYYDPHTNYFSVNEKEAFEEELSSEDFRFGISLATDESGHVVIDQLEPGGAAWKSNKLNKGDRLLKLQWENEPVIDVSEMTLNEIHEILQRNDKDILTFTVKKVNGSKKSVRLKKEKVELADDLVKSYLLTGNNKIGYIALPDFYTGWEGNSTKGCANDVAKEILKLQKENIEGIILDLRNNGGGSLSEALNLAGIFISEGPLAIDLMKNQKPITLKDENRGTVFKGPLVLLINGQSASASEVLAATLQDYNRALIVGQHSYGKATGQIIIPLDTSLNWQKIASRNFGNPAAYIKLTVSKLYRITGKSNQKRGVIPDVVLPDIYEGLYHREKDNKTVLLPDSINKKTYYTPLSAYPLAKLKDSAAGRIKTNPSYKNHIATRDSILLLLDSFKNGFELTLASHYNLINTLNRLSENLSVSSITENPVYTASNHAYEEEVLSIDSYYRELNNDVLKDLSGDIELTESFQIITDLINFTKK